MFLVRLIARRFGSLSVKDFSFLYLTNPRPLRTGRRGADAYVFMMPEYDQATSGALKNAIDFLCNEWNNTPASECQIYSLRG